MTETLLPTAPLPQDDLTQRDWMVEDWTQTNKNYLTEAETREDSLSEGGNNLELNLGKGRINKVALRELQAGFGEEP